MIYSIYLLLESERTKAAAEQRAADIRRGELAAAMSRLFGQAGRDRPAASMRCGQRAGDAPAARARGVYRWAMAAR